MRRSIQPSEATSAGTPLAHGVLGNGDLINGDGIARLISEDARAYAEVVAGRWLERLDFVGAASRLRGWSELDEGQRKFCFYMTAQLQLTNDGLDFVRQGEATGLDWSKMANAKRGQRDLARACAVGVWLESCAAQLETCEPTSLMPLLTEQVAFRLS